MSLEAIASDDSSSNTFDDLPEIDLGPLANSESEEARTVKAIRDFFKNLPQDENAERKLSQQLRHCSKDSLFAALLKMFPSINQISCTNHDIYAHSDDCTPNGTSMSLATGPSGIKRNGGGVTEKRTGSKRQKRDGSASVKMQDIYKPGECMKYMNVEMRSSLLDAWYAADVEREVRAAGARLVRADDLSDGLVAWTRSLQPVLEAKHGQVELSSSLERCDRALYIVCAEQIAEHVHEHTLAAHVRRVGHAAGCQLTLVVFGVKDFFNPKCHTQRRTRNLMTEIEMEMAFTDLLVSTDCDTAIVNTPNELALLIVQYTKAIAEAPFKKAKQVYDEQAEFYMRGAKKKSIHVDSDGRGLKQLWQQMMAILPTSSLETSRALCAEYKSPLELYEALQTPDSVNELADVRVSRAAVPGCKARRLGPEFAKKLHTLFTASDGNVLLE